jgi:peroxiredoxin
MSQVLSKRTRPKSLKKKSKPQKRTARKSSKKPTATIRGPAVILKPGTRAPEFSLYSTPDQKVSLSDFKGRPVVLAFYPADWSPVCTDQLSLYNQLLPEFERYNKPEILGISVDGIWSHIAFAKDRNLKFPILSDFEPKGDISKRYGVYQGKVGESSRALFVIDEHGTVRWSYLSPVGVNPGADGILNALEEMYPDKKRTT